MFENIGLKLKVFFFIAITFAFLSFMYFTLFEKLMKDINIQQGADNSFKLLEEKIKNKQYSLMAQSFKIASDIKISIDKKSRQFIFDGRNVDSNAVYALLDTDGTLVAGNFNILNSYAGIPAVQRAAASGIASDGYIQIDKTDYLLGVVPHLVPLDGDKTKMLIIVSAQPFTNVFKEFEIKFPVEIYSNGNMIYETDPEKWQSLFSSVLGENTKSEIKKLLASGGSHEIDRWNKLFEYSMPSDVRANYKITAIALLSYIPGFDIYKHMVMLIILYALAAIIVSLFFTFIVTHAVDKEFRNLAADMSRLKLGEKLLMHRYNHGAGLVVSAMNHLIGKYQKHGETNPGIEIAPLIRDNKDAEEIDEEISAPKKRLVEDTGIKENSIKKQKTDSPAVKQTQETDIISVESPLNDEDQYADLWDQYRAIKRKNGESVTDQEKVSFMGKLKTNKTTIVAKYNCKDVAFSIEEKDGKPIIKAKPVK